MKAFGKNINWLPIWLFTILCCLPNFIVSKPVNQPTQVDATNYLLENLLHKEYPVALPGIDTQQIIAQSRNAEEKGKNPSKYCLAGISLGLPVVRVTITRSFHFLYTHFFKYLFILYCVLLI